jgi:hypothetical protein
MSMNSFVNLNPKHVAAEMAYLLAGLGDDNVIILVNSYSFQSIVHRYYPFNKF